MNLEQLFEQWYNSEESSPANLKAATRQAFLAGHHQGMTRAAEIVEQVGISEGVDDKYQEVEIITAILTERDKEEK